MAFDYLVALFVTMGIVFVALGVWLLTLSFQDRLNRVFALYLLLEGGVYILRNLPVQDEQAWIAGLGRLASYLNIAAPFALLYLAASYRERFANAGLRRIMLPLCVAMAGLLWAVLIWGRAVRVREVLLVINGLNVLFTVAGPATMAAVLGHDALRSKGAWRPHLLIAALSFAFFPLAFGLHYVPSGLMQPTILERVFALVGLVPLAWFVVMLIQAAASVTGGLRSTARRALALLALAPVSVIGLWAYQVLLPRPGFVKVMITVMSVWSLILALLVTYTITRHQLFGIELRLKWTINRGSIVAAFLVVFGITTKLADAFADDLLGTYSWIVGGLAAAALGLALAPMQRLANRLANTAMPNVEPTSAYEAFRKVQVYQSALAAGWEDGQLKTEERSRLDALRRKLGLSERDAGAVEKDFARLAGLGSV